MKYLALSALFAMALGYGGYFLYMYDKKDRAMGAPFSAGERKSAEIKIPAHLTEEFWRQADPETLKETLKTVKNINEVRPGNQQSMLHLLVIHGKYPEMIDMLISAGADWTLKDKIAGELKIERSRALHYVFNRKEKSYEFAKELLKHDKDIEAVAWGATPLIWAVYDRQPLRAIKLLLEKGANPRAKSHNKSNVLIYASKPNVWTGEASIDPETVQLFLDLGVDIAEKNSKGETAYSYMKKNPAFTQTELFKKIAAQFE